jgi:hypothetical protein
MLKPELPTHYLGNRDYGLILVLRNLIGVELEDLSPNPTPYVVCFTKPELLS